MNKSRVLCPESNMWQGQGSILNLVGCARSASHFQTTIKRCGKVFSRLITLAFLSVPPTFICFRGAG